MIIILNIIMDNNNSNAYIKTDNNRIINETCIRWVHKIGECLEVCITPNGCDSSNTQTICKENNPESYAKLNKWFK